MAKKVSGWKTKGMNRDFSVSAFNPEFAFENMNLRLSTNEGNTLMSWVNERGTEKIGIHLEGNNTTPSPVEMTLSGTPIGTAVLNNKLVLFATSDTRDYIYRLEYIGDNAMKCKILYDQKLGFSVNHPLETLVSFESEDIQKVYWTDGVNQPRVINISDSVTTIDKPAIYFDFVPTLLLNETVKVKKILSGSGMFAPGVIQYALTYYNKYGQETNIFYTSPLMYISYKERGGSPEDKIENAFRITISSPDRRFEYIRIYSIQRTSVNGTPLCKRVQDICLKDIKNNDPVSYTDTGLSGDSIDPTELLYKGGEIVSAATMEQKDNTLFLGNLNLTRHSVTSIKDSITADVYSSTRAFRPMQVSTGYYTYYNQLTSEGPTDTDDRHYGMTVPCGGFKTGDYYRLGLQFQHESGKWSEPVPLMNPSTGTYDYLETKTPSENGDVINVPTFAGMLRGGQAALRRLGYIKVRPLVVFPNMMDRNVICQGVANPTLYTSAHRNEDKDIYAQASWFFRPQKGNAIPAVQNGAVFPKSGGWLNYTNRSIENPGYNPAAADDNIRSVEIQGDFDQNKNQFKIDRTQMLTLHSPEIEFDDALQTNDFLNVRYRQVGDVRFGNTLSEISIQTESPTISNSSSGFIHKAFSDSSNHGIVSGLFYEDWIVDDMGDGENFTHFEKYSSQYQNSPIKWMVYLWNKDGSLNNDINRPSDKGTPSAVLKKKVISNLRYTTSSLYRNTNSYALQFDPQIFSSDEPTILKFDDAIYRGNIDTILIPDKADGMYFALGNGTESYPPTPYKYNIDTPFTSDNWWKTFSLDPESNTEGYGLWRRKDSVWEHVKIVLPDTIAPVSTAKYEVGKYYIDLVSKKSGVRVKYKSTPHMVLRQTPGSSFDGIWNDMSLPIIEITRTTSTNPFGGNTNDALKENVWLPCGEPVDIEATIHWDYGDTYFQRYDCLKTYAYTKEDVNQVVEIGSFMLETHVNIDGRYDRNRGQSNNLNMSPQNFNLINPVYSQKDNFFTYRILDSDYYSSTKFPNQLTWSKTKENGADVDLWTNITLASILELDGDKGKLNKLIRFNNYLFAFQDTGISQILYNDNVQISSTDGVPIEIANSGKVQGKDYKSNTVGCSNKWSMTTTPNGIYFMDSYHKDIYLFNGQLNNISTSGGFNSWCKKNIVLTAEGWKPDFSTKDFKACYDKLNQDVLFINDKNTLAWSEKLQAFTSFYDYGNTPFFCNVSDTGLWIRQNGFIWKHQGSDKYCQFFGESKPYWMTLVGNPEPQTDKIFTNLEFRACVEGEGPVGTTGSTSVFDETFDETFRVKDKPQPIEKFIPYLPFDYLETWDEYQHGVTKLELRNGHSAMVHHDGDSASLKRKFRMWRCDIPRDNVVISVPDTATDEEKARATDNKRWDKELGVSRIKQHPVDRMRNPWIYLKLMKEVDENNNKAEIHDVVMTYYN